ncbi:MAG TPA: response regulator transcription factor [Thermomicrobiales bacterium]|jgi:DNA-binding NarL/FixJ family response regulator|nr:response regulator transcription factor [Thermomicrobiales bacterium]
MIRVVLVDDQAMIRAGLRGILETSGDITVVGEGERGSQGVDLVRALRPDVVLMDLRMPGVDGVEAIRMIRADPSLAGVRILVLTTFETDDNVLAALRVGANGFLGKGADPGELIAGVRQVAAGGSLLSPAATQSVVQHMATTANVEPAPTRAAPRLSSVRQMESLTPRERETLRLVGEGRDNDEIADLLDISILTAKTHINRTMSKLGVSSRAQLVRIAHEYGLVD